MTQKRCCATPRPARAWCGLPRYESTSETPKAARMRERLESRSRRWWCGRAGMKRAVRARYRAARACTSVGTRWVLGGYSVGGRCILWLCCEGERGAPHRNRAGTRRGRSGARHTERYTHTRGGRGTAVRRLDAPEHVHDVERPQRVHDALAQPDALGVARRRAEAPPRAAGCAASAAAAAAAAIAAATAAAAAATPAAASRPAATARPAAAATAASASAGARVEGGLECRSNLIRNADEDELRSTTKIGPPLDQWHDRGGRE
eukprot:5592057-Prymnesium_polylepis.2